MMGKFAIAGQLSAGKSDELIRFSDEILGPRKAEYDEYLRRYHLIKEFGWIQHTPMGDMSVMYDESTTDYLEESRKFAESDEPFDVWFKQTAGNIIGMDLTKPTPPNFEEVLYDWEDSNATGTFRPLASVLPVLEGKAGSVRQMIDQINGPKRADNDDSHRRYQMAAENWFLEHTPNGDALIYYIEAVDPIAVFKDFATSQNDFDKWGKQVLTEISGVDMNQPPQIPELIIAAQMAPVPAR